MSGSQSIKQKPGTESYVNNYSDVEFTLKEYKFKCQSLQTKNRSMIQMRQNLIILNQKNNNISKCLLRIKKEYEKYKSDLGRTLFHQRVRTDKEKILSGKIIKSFTEKRNNIEKHLKVSPLALELEELTTTNNSLFEEYTKMSSLLDLTKIQYEIMMDYLIKSFNMKVCEFCETVLTLNALSG